MNDLKNLVSFVGARFFVGVLHDGYNVLRSDMVRRSDYVGVLGFAWLRPTCVMANFVCDF
ncbi:hypothetical protein IQ266_21720 [filamentous cyanobacterium LEGE 11480]|uniref:Uncharacterized protein n=1 Tax=Romeriopsis navalis LEGE 11480 TaxID=2777977 RepID=A0A928Z6M3_9CYAN|nr:hypothetical protein [Romeriopsis navalis]MBE9032360.1 hypothetical protein [Romeriopsis navalis LEGE 11480]